MSTTELLTPTQVGVLPSVKAPMKAPVKSSKKSLNERSKRLIISVPKTTTYPERDGKPMSDNTVQFKKIMKIQGNLDILYKRDPNVFVAGDLLWYPVEGNNVIRAAPDVMVAFGRHKEDRGSYRQWEEENIPPQVAFEIISPGNTTVEMQKKRAFYERYGVQEYYEYDPQKGTLIGWQSKNGLFQEIKPMSGWKSPLLGVTFKMDGKELLLYYPDGRLFVPIKELDNQREKEQQGRIEAENRAAEEELARIEAENRVVSEEQARIKAENRAAEEELARIEAENRVVSEEQARIKAENRAAEEELARIEAENRVVSEEQARIKAENRAAEEELARIEAENHMAEEEQARFDAENRMAEEEQARVAAENRMAEEGQARVAAENRAAEEIKARIDAENRAAEMALLLQEMAEKLKAMEE